MDSALTVMVVFGVVALAAAGAAAFYSWSRRNRVLERARPVATPAEPLHPVEPVRRTVEEERVRKTVRERAPTDRAPAGTDRDDLRRPL